MALTPEQIDILADKYIIGLYRDLENEIIGDLARRVKKTGRYTETAEIMVKSMTEQGYSASKIQSEVFKLMRADKDYIDFVAENTKEYKAFVQSEIDETIKEAKKNGNKLIADAGNMAYNSDLSMWSKAGVDLTKPNTMSQLMTAFRLQTLNELKNITRTTGFKNTTFAYTGVMNAYQKEMDLALLKVASGTFSYDQAVNDCVHRLAQSGLRSIDYANGRSYQLDTAARMSVRTGLSQLSGKITEENIKNTGVELVITSQHMGSRPEHAEWQNKVFTYSGKPSSKYPDFVDSTGYGSVTGLKGANCSHDFYPYWEGISVDVPDLKEPDPVTINGKEYDYYSANQKQRQMESGIRATKREIEAQRAIGGDISQLNAKLRKQNSDYKQFSVDAGLRAKTNKLKVVAGTSDIGKAKIESESFKTHKSVGAMVKKFYVSEPKGLSDSGLFIKADTEVTGIKVMTSGIKIREVDRLIECYPLPNGEKTSPQDWYKVRGRAIITNNEGYEESREIHWYQAKNIGKVEFKFPSNPKQR